MHRILCLGNNTEDTDRKTRMLAENSNMLCHGLLSELDHPITEDDYVDSGVYHSSIYDLEYGRLANLANRFNQVIMLDQSKDQWTHPDAFYNTVRLMRSLSVPVIFQNPEFPKDVDYWGQLVETNKSFCIFPFIELLAYGNYSTVCCRSQKPVAKIDPDMDFANDPEYQKIRHKMLNGTKLPEHCLACYRLENIGFRSPRQQETIEWANRLNLSSVEDLAKITKPPYYEVRSSNKCNLQCRMCNPMSSHLIESEYRKIGLLAPDAPPTSSFDRGFEIVDFSNLKKLYVSGGEPLIMPEFYEFMDQCIDNSRTDFEFLINTNGTKLSDKFKKQIRNFNNLQFIFSIDGYRDLNHYIRWPSDWNTVINNWRYLRDQGHKITINTSVSIYNVSRLHELFVFIDLEFPNTLTHIQIVEVPSYLSPFLYPMPEKAIDSLKRVQALDCYRNDPLFANNIDGLITKFQSSHDITRLDRFFEFNDRLDRSRKIRLNDHLPELELYRPK